MLDAPRGHTSHEGVKFRIQLFAPHGPESAHLTIRLLLKKI